MLRALAVLLAATCIGATPTPSSQANDRNATPSTTITATDFQFTPAEIHAVAGQPFQITLVNKGKSVHSLRFHFPNNEYPFPTNVPPGQSATAVMDAVTDPGTYTFYCPVDEHRDRGMTGKLIVSAGK